MLKTPQEIVESYGKTVNAVFVYGTASDNIETVNSDKINEIRYYFDGALYSSVMRCMEFKLIGNFTAKIKKGHRIRLMTITVKDPDGNEFSITPGAFHVAEDPEYDAAQNLTSIITYDDMYLTMQQYNMSLDWTNGITLKNYLITILQKLRIQYNLESLKLMANSDKLITSEKFIDIENDETESAYTYRDVLDEIAKAAGVSFAFQKSITGDDINPGQLYAVKPTESGIVIDESNLKSVTIGAEYGPVKGVVLSREPQEDNIYYPSSLTEDDTAVKISNVEIMEDAEDDTYRQNFIQGIYSNVIGTKYYLYDLDSFGILLLNFGDIFTIKACDRMDGTIGEEKSYKTILMRTDITIGDGISEKSKLEAPQVTSTDYSAASTTDKTLKKTMLKVDKQNQKITGYIKDADGKYSLLVQTVEGIDLKIEDPENGLKAQLTATAEKATAAYSKAETVQGQVDGVTTQIESIKNELSGLDENIANKVTTEVQKDTTIEILAGKVNSQISGNYVTKTDYDDEKKNWVLLTDYNSRLEQTDQSITASVNRIQTLENAGYITQETAESLISAQADNITLSVERNLKIGARNILLDSACFGSFTPSGHNTKKVEISNATDTSVPSGKTCKISFNSSVDGISGFYFLNSDIIAQKSEIDKIKPNVTYTLSFWAKKNANSGLGNLTKQNVIYAGQNTSVKFDNDRSVFPAISEQWQKYVLTFLIEGTIEYFYIRFLFENCSIYEFLSGTQYSVSISSLKLEEGNIATDWTPSAEDIDQSVKAQIDLCVKTDENGKLVSEILIESNKLRIETDKFTLNGDGAVTCSDLTVEGGGKLKCGLDDHNMTITNARLIHTVDNQEIGRIGIALDRFNNNSELIKGSNSVMISAGEKYFFEFDSNGTVNNGLSNGLLSAGTDIFCGYRHYRQFEDDSGLSVFHCGTGIYSDKTLGVELYDDINTQIDCAIKIKRENYNTSTVTIYGFKEYNSSYITSPGLSLRTDGLYYNGQKLAYE